MFSTIGVHAQLLEHSEEFAQPELIHETLPYHVGKILNVIRPAMTKRSMRQFGNYLKPGGRINAGIGPLLRTSMERDQRPAPKTASRHRPRPLACSRKPAQTNPIPRSIPLI